MVPQPFRYYVDVSVRIALLAAALAMCGAAAEYRAWWVDAFHGGFKTPAEVDKLVEDATTSRTNALFVQMRRRGDVYFLESSEPPAEDVTYQPGFDALAYTIEKAHARGMEVHA